MRYFFLVFLTTNLLNAQKLGIGWDEGCSLRLFLGKKSGIGFSINPAIKTNDNIFPKNYTADTTISFDVETNYISTSFEVFRSIIERDGINVLPYLRFTYAIENNEKYISENGIIPSAPENLEVNSIVTEIDSYKFEIGFQFQKTIFKNFILGTRIGLESKYSFTDKRINGKIGEVENYAISMTNMNFHDGIKFWVVF